MTIAKPRGKATSRTYSKRVTAVALAGIYGLAGYGLYTGSPHTAEIVTVVGSAAVAMLMLYMGVGHLDLRSTIASGLLDLRKKGPPNAG